MPITPSLAVISIHSGADYVVIPCTSPVWADGCLGIVKANGQLVDGLHAYFLGHLCLLSSKV